MKKTTSRKGAALAAPAIKSGEVSSPLPSHPSVMKASRKAQREIRDKANPTHPGKENRRRAAERQTRRAERKAKLADAWHANVARDKAKQAAAAKAARHAIDRSRLLSLLRHRHKVGGRISSWAMWSLEKYRVRVFLHARREKEQVSPSAPVSYSFRSSIRFASLCQAWQAIRSWRVISGECSVRCASACQVWQAIRGECSVRCASARQVWQVTSQECSMHAVLALFMLLAPPSIRPHLC